MTPIQQLMLGVGASKKTYIDDVYSTFLYDGTGSAQSINNGINLSGKGGLVWVKKRNNSGYSHVMDTSRGAGKSIHTDQSDAESDTSTALTAFNSNGFSIGAHGGVNQSGYKISSFSFRKAPGFFDIVTYTGNGSARTIAHSLGCVPGCVMIKCTSTAKDWCVWHRGATVSTPGNVLYLNLTDTPEDTGSIFNDTAPTASVFTIETGGKVNENGETYVAYLFAGGESTAATARCVEMDGTGDYFTTSTSSDYTFGTGDFTVETWVRIDEDYATNNSYPTILDARTDGSYGNFWVVYAHPTDKTIRFYNAGADRITSNIKIERGQWYHIAVVRNSAVTQFYVNGISQGTYSDSTDYSHTSIVWGSNAVSLGSYVFDGALSNLRVVKGTAVYTSSFRPPTEPLTNITNTKLLCFNNSSTTGTTVGTITASGDPTASTNSPFDDPAGFKFGENGDQGIIKCGSYIGGLAGMEVNVGFEPQWLLIKSASNTRSWQLADCMRGFTAKGLNDEFISVDSSNAAADDNRVWPTPTGFGLDATDSAYNWTGSTYVYMAIRRPDGYVGKPAEAGTDVFGMSTGTADSSIPLFSGSFPVDFSLHRATASTSTWYTGARLMQGKYLRADTNDAEATHAPINYAFNAGWNNQDVDASASQSWQWKRHAGFDAVTYEGDGVAGRAIPHSLSKTPEMMWVKCRDSAGNWRVYHKGLNGGTNPEQYRLFVNTDAEESALTTIWNDTAPTSTHFTLGTHSDVNGNGNDYIAMLFASVDGISALGSYDGSANDKTISLTFVPRFVIVKCTTDSGDWLVLDTTRGWVTGNDSRLYLNLDSAAAGNIDVGYLTGSGFVLNGSQNGWNNSGRKYIYYAHA